MPHCRNCGHESHCGVPMYKEFKDPLSTPNMLEVCKKCRCERCEVKTDYG